MIQRVKTGVIADGAVTLAKLNDETENAFSFRNRVHNGDFRINQRGTASRSNTLNNLSASDIGSSSVPADRWFNFSVYSAVNGLGATNCTIAIVNDHPVVSSGNCYSITLNTNATANANVVVSNLTTDFFGIAQTHEGFTFSDLYSTSSTTSMTLSFWVKSNKTGAYSVQLRPNGDGSGRTILLPYTINSSGTWERKTLSVPAFTFGNIPNDSASRLAIYFYLASNLKATHTDGLGSTITQAQIDACTNQWGPNYWGSGIVVNNHVNFFENTGNYFRITDVQLEPGSAATPFERRPYGAELQICQRYYQHQVPTWGTPRAGDNYCHSLGFFKVTMRANPSLSLSTNIYGQTPVSIQSQNADYYVTAVQITSGSSFGGTFNSSAEI